ncbi:MULTISPECIES: hypothetical protein [unclassified Mesotoga]|uniref:hypothetical protein n=1 Tax=unclassified Mesotoga TaxID=1184398 RepID=UPI000DA68B2E|nr:MULTISPECIES: hypothetical protein [unclassified Mesotoga]PZC51511.1 hypothetical protein LH53_10665 [Mesotoga sp. TolDC]
MEVDFGKLQLTEEKTLESYFEESINLKLINSLIIAKEKEKNFRGNELSSYFKGYLLPLYKDFGKERRRSSSPILWLKIDFAK